MEKRHLFEVEQQQEALAEFNDLDRIKEIVDWDRFTPILEGPLVLPGPRRVVGSSGYLSLSSVGDHAWVE